MPEKPNFSDELPPANELINSADRIIRAHGRNHFVRNIRSIRNSIQRRMPVLKLDMQLSQRKDIKLSRKLLPFVPMLILGGSIFDFVQTNNSFEQTKAESYLECTPGFRAVQDAFQIIYPNTELNKKQVDLVQNIYLDGPAFQNSLIDNPIKKAQVDLLKQAQTCSIKANEFADDTTRGRRRVDLLVGLLGLVGSLPKLISLYNKYGTENKDIEAQK